MYFTPHFKICLLHRIIYFCRVVCLLFLWFLVDSLRLLLIWNDEVLWKKKAKSSQRMEHEISLNCQKDRSLLGVTGCILVSTWQMVILSVQWLDWLARYLLRNMRWTTRDLCTSCKNELYSSSSIPCCFLGNFTDHMFKFLFAWWIERRGLHALTSWCEVCQTGRQIL